MSDLLIGKVRVAQRDDASLIGSIAEQLPTQLGARRFLATRQHERRVAEIDERDLTTILYAPAMPKPGRQTRLTPVRHPRGRDFSRHACIVTGRLIQVGAHERSSRGRADRRQLDSRAPQRPRRLDVSRQTVNAIETSR